MYSIGEMIVYGELGVCRVTEVARRSMPGGCAERLYYTVEPLREECTIYAPAEGKAVFMRRIVTRDEALRLIDGIPAVRAEAYHNKVISQLADHYETVLKTHDCAALLELTMSIYAKKQQLRAQKRRFGATDERFLKRAEELLFGEFGAALGIAPDEVPDYIAARVGALTGAEEEENG